MSEEPTEEDRAEFARVAREAADDMYRAIGKSITIWSKMEGSLVGVAAMLLDCKAEKVGLVLYSINNFHSWLSIIEDLFAMDSRYTPLRPDWIKISERLKKCNDTRVALAHHALVPGMGLDHFIENEIDDFSAAFPTLKPNRLDSRTRAKKRTPIGTDELSTFIDDMGLAIEKLSELIDRMTPLFSERQKLLTSRLRQINEKLQVVNAHRDAIRTSYGG